MGKYAPGRGIPHVAESDFSFPYPGLTVDKPKGTFIAEI
jgi:hypothetical protein